MSPSWLYVPAASSFASEDWFTYQNGAGTFTRLNNGADETITYESAYSAQTDMTAVKTEAIQGAGTFPQNFTPMTNANGSGSFPPYIAIYVQAGTGFSNNDTSGWHVFQNSNVGFGLRDRYRIPVAWPTNSNNNDGRLGTNQTTNKKCAIATLSQAPSASGAGGTDSWTAPTFL